MKLDITYRQWINSGTPDNLVIEMGLCQVVGVCDRYCLSRMVGACSKNDSDNVVVVSFGIF